MMTLPPDPIAAVTHDDPYAYYAGLVARRPIHFDDRLGLWIAAGADTVTSVLGSELGRVRPPAEPVPPALLGTPAGDIFRHLVRMNDGAGHCPFKQAISATLAAVDEGAVMVLADRRARLLSGGRVAPPGGGDVNDFAFALSPHVIGGLLGVPDDRLPEVAQWTGDFVRCIAPAADAGQLARGNAAASRLLTLFHDMLAAGGDGILAGLAHEARHVGRSAADVIVANGIGFLSQAYEATAGLIGNSLVALARHHDVHVRVQHDGALLRDLVQEVLRHDAPVQSTRRFVAGDGVIAGQRMKAGDAILVVLAAANRDPAANPQPARFDIERKGSRCFTFGAGVHACPGERIATAIAQAGVAALITAGLNPDSLLEGMSYRPSANVRIPIFPDRA